MTTTTEALERSAVPGVVIVELTGELDVNDRQRVARGLVRALDGRGRRIVVDASSVSFMDTSILRLIRSVASGAERRRGSLVLVVERHGLRRILRVTGFDRDVAVANSLDEALGTAG
jgi:anti-anti-sigma factor